MDKKLRIALLATILMIAIMHWHNKFVKTSLTPQGVFSIEKAGDISTMDRMVAATGAAPLKVHIYIDFLLIAAYSYLLYVGTKSLTSSFTSRGSKRIAFIFLEMSLAIGALDLLSNILLLITFSGNGGAFSARIINWALYGRFILLGLLLAFLFIASVTLIVKSVQKGEAADWPDL